MREIKFRAWNGEEMLPQDALYWDVDTFITGVWDFEETHVVSNRNAPVIMQYTGLKDKNGKEIYEGDIIRAYDKFSVRHFTANYADNDKYYQWRSWEYCEVIGNIYENPELLKGA